MKLVTFDDGDRRRDGVLDGDQIAVLDVPTMSEWTKTGEVYAPPAMAVCGVM